MGENLDVMVDATKRGPTLRVGRIFKGVGHFLKELYVKPFANALWIGSRSSGGYQQIP